VNVCTYGVVAPTAISFYRRVCRHSERIKKANNGKGVQREDVKEATDSPAEHGNC
jgi:hypothetical protein